MKRTSRLGSFLLILSLLLTAVCLPATADTLSPAGRVTTKDTGLNIRQSASPSSPVVGKLSKGTAVRLLSKSGSWYRVQYGPSATGYCAADYITPLTGSTVMYVATASSRLNVRSGAGTGYPVQTALAKGTRVVRLSVSGSWSRILYHGTATGYVSSNYLSASAPAAAGGVALAVPKFYQTDSRWAHLPLGNSNTTIGRSGCATTCLAMTESHRLGQTVTPAMMAQKLSYTASGSVYWPSNYSQTTVSSNDLTFLYNKLKAGKPVILGLKNSAGGMHFVVVTGCSDNTAAASSFTVNDPGSSSRTTLSQVLAVYPVFYKMLWVG